jgi:hypothetical protein
MVGLAVDLAIGMLIGALAKYGRASEADGVEAHTDGSNPSRSASNYDIDISL